MDVWGGAAEYLVGRIGRQSVFNCFRVDLFDSCLVGGFVEYFIYVVPGLCRFLLYIVVI